jgi:hypothetical protein
MRKVRQPDWSVHALRFGSIHDRFNGSAGDLERCSDLDSEAQWRSPW